MGSSWFFPIGLLILTALASTVSLPLAIFIGFVFLISLSGIRVIYQYENGVMFRLGHYKGLLGPGLNYFIPVIENLVKVDMRITTVDIPKQEVMTKDNVPVKVNAVVYFRAKDPERAILNVEHYKYAVSQYAQTALRDVIGGEDLDNVLSKREDISAKIEKIVDVETDPWGIDVTAIKMQDVELPEDMKRTMAKQAEAERERRGVIIKSEGEVIASRNLAKAAKTLLASPGALHLRTLNTLNDLSSDQSNTVIFTVPLEILRAFEAIGDYGLKNK